MGLFLRDGQTKSGGFTISGGKYGNSTGEMNAVYTIYNCKPPNAMSIPPTFCFYDGS